MINLLAKLPSATGGFMGRPVFLNLDLPALLGTFSEFQWAMVAMLRTLPIWQQWKRTEIPGMNVPRRIHGYHRESQGIRGSFQQKSMDPGSNHQNQVNPGCTYARLSAHQHAQICKKYMGARYPKPREI